MNHFKSNVLFYGIVMSFIFCCAHKSIAATPFSVKPAENGVSEPSSFAKKQAYLLRKYDVKSTVTIPQKKLSTDLLQLIDSRFLPVNTTIEHVVNNMQSLRQLSLSSVGRELDQKVRDGRVYVYISFHRNSDESIFDPFGVNITHSDTNNPLVAAWVQVKDLESIAALDSVRTIRTVLPPITRTGSILTEGDEVHRSSDVRSIFSQQGAGIKVGIVSDSVDNRADAQAIGDLPADGAGLTVLHDVEGDDEGTAMLEIVHDMVPNAELFFHDAGNNVIEFNSAIDALVSAGCNIICDDMGWLDEPFFEDGIIATHIRSVIAQNDIIYVTASGNEAQEHYQGTFHSLSTSLPEYHDFSHGMGDLTDLYVNIPVDARVLIILQWNDLFGASGNDYDLALYSRTAQQVVAVGEDYQDGDDNPFEYIVYTATESTRGDFEIWVTNFSDSDSKILEVIISSEYPAGNYPNNITPVDSIFGHPAVPEVVAVGAIAVNNSDDPEHLQIEDFSSQGPVTISHPGVEIRQKPDICGVDRVSVSGAGGFPSIFAGTSASAPHVAAIMAQLWAAMPECTGDEIRDMVLADAVDLEEVGIDNIAGYGRADALNAFYSNYYMVEMFPYFEDFECDGNLPIGWRNGLLDETNWRVHSGGTSTALTGPSSAYSGDYYLYIEASSHADETALLESPYIKLSLLSPGSKIMEETFYLEYWYHMRGSEMGTLSVEITEDQGHSWDVLESHSAHQGNDWERSVIYLDAYYNQRIKLRFRGVTGSGYTSDMAIDSVGIDLGSPVEIEN
ncbi:MAG: S8 family serine peptidase [Sedimentisphaerales bacterium]|nr:S8 family serine peptidase [Sedimentisphaerales bacterium]